MTIRRQYILPNCTLILEGLSDGTLGQLDARPLMTILVNAECHFTGHQQRLSGGRDFFESLVHSVSRYAQEFLSQVHHPKLPGDKSQVLLQKVKGKDLHRLTLLPAAEAVPTGGGYPATSHFQPQQETVQMDLTTVQLFDLVDAIDQFLGDRQTLPDIGVTLQPLPRRYRSADEPIAKRAAPAALGVTSLAVAAIAFLLVPVPQVREPKPTESTPTTSNTASPSPSGQQATATPTPSTTTSPAASDVEKALTAAEITDPTQLKFLQRKLYSKLDDAWKERGQVSENLEYRIAVGQDGAIIGYKSVNEAAGGDAAKKTPLPELLYKPTTGSIANSEPLAQYRVVFNNRGILQISPWRGYAAKPSLGPEITDTDKIGQLNNQLYDQLRKEWTNQPIYQKDLIYRVAVTEDGTIADFEPTNQPASDYVKETPLERLIKPDAAGISQQGTGGLPQKPLAQYRVVFRQNGVLEVSPFLGNQ